MVSDTLGNCMRRVLLSSLDGAKATAIRIEGVQHEFTTAEGVIEDITDIVLNVKGLVFLGPLWTDWKPGHHFRSRARAR